VRIAACIATLVLCPLWSARTVAQIPEDFGCDLCHGELELLRARVPTLARAESLLAPSAELLASAHGELGCGDCHDGVERFPHRPRRGVEAVLGGSTSTCVSCHEEAGADWSSGVHAGTADADCASCHGVHAVRSQPELREGAGLTSMNDACASCHTEAVLPGTDPHAEEVSCASCHRPHATRSIDDPASWIAALSQPTTCGICHDTASAPLWADAHTEALALTALPDEAPPLDPAGQQVDAGDSQPGPHDPLDAPTCSSCHESHPLRWSGSDGPQAMAGVCEGCHEEYGETFADSYHGQAMVLGSTEVAGCVACHSAHAIFPASDDRSTVASGNLVETCGECHTRSSEGFVQFQPHASHDDPERYPHVYWTARLMTALLVGVFGVFGVHSVLWLRRLTLDAMKRADAPSGRDG
jgi:predicted CXXCH cytochrome family protein